MSELLRVLITNDDGIDAPGIAAIEAALSDTNGFEAWVVAPDRERSTCSHGMTLGADVTSVRRKERAFAVSGLPADCVFLGINGLLPVRPHLVISGINRGANLGTDVIFSGTVAGARQAALMGIAGIATSLTAGEDYDRAAEMIVALVRDNRERLLGHPYLLNLNFPSGAPKGIRFAALGRRKYPQRLLHGQGDTASRITFRLGGPDVIDALIPGSDGAMIHQGFASATLLSADQTDSMRMIDPIHRLQGIEPT